MGTARMAEAATREQARSELFAGLVSDVAAALGLGDGEDRSKIGKRVAELKRKARLLREALTRLYIPAKAIMPYMDNAASNEEQVKWVMELGDATRIANTALRETKGLEAGK